MRTATLMNIVRNAQGKIAYYNIAWSYNTTMSYTPAQVKTYLQQETQ